MINQLVEEIEQPPYHIAPAEVWKAYEQLEKAKVKGVSPESKLPILISLIRLATGVTDVLEPFTELVNNRFDNWIKQQANTTGRDFKPDQLDWLNKIKEQIAQNAAFRAVFQMNHLYGMTVINHHRQGQKILLLQVWNPKPHLGMLCQYVVKLTALIPPCLQIFLVTLL